MKFIPKKKIQGVGLANKSTFERWAFVSIWQKKNFKILGKKKRNFVRIFPCIKWVGLWCN